MSLDAADLTRLETNIDAAQVWVEGDSATNLTAANGRSTKTVAKVNAEAVAAFNSQLQGIALQPPVAWSASLLIDEATKTVIESGVIYAPLPSLVPFTTGGSFNSANWYVVQGLTQNGTLSAFGNLATPLCELRLKNNIDFRGAGSATFARATTGTYIDRYGVVQSAAIDAARFEKEGLLIEGASTNLAVRSEEFDNASWGKVRSSITANAVNGPDGTLTADKLVEDSTAATSHYVNQTITLTASTDCTISVFAKVAERSQIQLNNVTTGDRAIFDITTLTISSIVGTISTNITELSDGWVMCDLSFDSGVGGAQVINIRLASGGTDEYTGDGTSGLYLWGAQVEELAFPTSYIPTVAATVTRSSDLLSIDVDNNTVGESDDVTITGSFNISNLPSGGSGSARYLYWSDATSNISEFHIISTSDSLAMVNGSVFSSLTIANTFKATMTYNGDTNVMSSYVNESLDSQLDAGSAFVPDVTGSINIGGTGSVSELFGHVSWFAIYDSVLTAQEVAFL